MADIVDIDVNTPHWSAPAQCPCSHKWIAVFPGKTVHECGSTFLECPECGDTGEKVVDRGLPPSTFKLDTDMYVVVRRLDNIRLQNIKNAAAAAAEYFDWLIAFAGDATDQSQEHLEGRVKLYALQDALGPLSCNPEEPK